MNNEKDAAAVRHFPMVVVFLLLIGIAAAVPAYGPVSSRDGRPKDVIIAERLAPVGKVNIGEPFILPAAGETAEATAAVADHEPQAEMEVAVADTAMVDPGKAVYGKICFACHDAGVGGAPKLGDQAGWADRMDKGAEMLTANAINGYTGELGIMPPKGGLSSLSDDDVKAAVEYMLAAMQGDDAAAAMPEAEPAASAEQVADGRGKEVYDSACFICHATGVAGAPKIGDSSSWGPRVAQGTELLYTHAIKGYMGEAGLMPPKGGRMDYSDDDVKAAVDYMVNNSQ